MERRVEYDNMHSFVWPTGPDWPPLPALIRVWVDDAQATMTAAEAAGAG